MAFCTDWERHEKVKAHGLLWHLEKGSVTGAENTGRKEGHVKQMGPECEGPRNLDFILCNEPSLKTP